MSLTGNLYTINSSTATTIVAPSIDAQEVLIRNIMPIGADNYYRDGYTFSAHTDFTLPNNGTVSFSFTTGAYGAQIIGYVIATTASNLEADLVEGATIVTGETYPSYNLNRASTNVADALLKAATTVTGGTTISSESIYATNQSSSRATNSKVISLAPSTQYAMKFVNTGSQSTLVHFELIWGERFDGYTTAWLNGAKDVGFPLQAGEDLKMTLLRSQSITAISGGAPISIAVMRQD